MKRFKNLKIEVKFRFLIAVFIASSLSVLYSMHFFSNAHMGYNQLIYATCRQDVLLKSIEAYSAIPVQDKRSAEVEELIYWFRASVDALKTGGKVAGLDDEVVLPANKDKKVLSLISSIENQWNETEEILLNKDTHTKDAAYIVTSISGLRSKNALLLDHYKGLREKELQLKSTVLATALLLISISAFLLFWFFRRYINNPLVAILKSSQTAATGDLSHQTNYTATDEIGKVANCIDTIINNQLVLSTFAEKIGEGDFHMEYNLLSKADKLGISLTSMRDKLQKVSVEDKKRTWSAEGMARFGEILRMHNENIQLLSETIISHLVKYIGANQGAFFIAYKEENEASDYLDLIATYAWERKKFVKKRVAFGEGLTGQVFRDKDTVFMTDIPESYVSITSGLGKANPTSLLLVPLKVNEEVHGVIELASFKEFADFEIEFVEKLAESIAATLSSVKTNEKTKRLLAESRMMNEQMRSQEEEMRQNLEELSSTQEEMQRKEVELVGLFTCINNTLATIEFDLEGSISTANTTFCRLMGYSLEELRGKHHRIMVDKSEANSAAYKEFWQELGAGITKVADVKRFTKDGREIWLSGSYTPVLNKDGRPYKIIKLAQDITGRKQDEIKAKRLSLVADNTANSVIITGKDGLIEYVNQGFIRMTGYELEEVIGKKPGSFLQGPETNQETIERIRQNIQDQKPFYDEILNYNKSGQSYWISLAINPVFDEAGKLDKFIAIQANITETKIKNLDFNSKLEAISKSNAVIEFDIEGNIITTNNNFLHVMGYTLEEIQGRHHSIFVVENEKESQEYKEIWERLAKGESVSGEFVRITKAGKQVWVREIFNVILDINGKASKVVKFMQDITSEKQLELESRRQAEELSKQGEKLRKYTEELEELQRTLSKKLEEAKGEMKLQIIDLEAEKAKNVAILEGCVDGVIAFNHRGTVEFFNKAAEDIWRISRKEVLRRSITLLMPLAFTEPANGNSKVVFSEGNVNKEIGIRTEVNFTDRVGEEVDVLLTLTQAKLGEEFTYTLFVQKISVELF